MNKQFDSLLKLYKDYIVVFNNWQTTNDSDLEKLVRIFVYLTDILEKNEIIEKYGIKKYRVIESGEII
jgi:hypothetical protein